MLEAFNEGRLDVADEVLTPDYVNHDPSQPRPIDSREAMKGFITYLRTAVPDVHFTVDDTVAEGDKVVYRWSATGTQQGEFFGAPPTGRSFSTAGIIIARLADGRIAEEWVEWDTMGMLRQLGVLPAPEGAPA